MGTIEPKKSATFSSCALYRYTLTRTIDQPTLFAPSQGTGVIAWCMLNPSTADAENDDPTIRRCIGFSKDWGYRKVLIVNAYAYRATDPKAMWKSQNDGVDIVGPDNDSAIAKTTAQAQVVIAAWGTECELGRAQKVCKLIGASKLHCLGICKDGSPKHPLYLSHTLEPQRWRGMWSA